MHGFWYAHVCVCARISVTETNQSCCQIIFSFTLCSFSGDLLELQLQHFGDSAEDLVHPVYVDKIEQKRCAYQDVPKKQKKNTTTVTEVKQLHHN